MSVAVYRDDPLIGRTKLCRKCESAGEPDPFWPLDDEFWYATGRKVSGGVLWDGLCRACRSEYDRNHYRNLTPEQLEARRNSNAAWKKRKRNHVQVAT